MTDRTKLDAWLLIVGAGPAGCHAAAAAAGVKRGSLLIDPAVLAGGNLPRITHLNNLPGFASGAAYAQALRNHLAGLDELCTYIQAEVVKVEATDDCVRVLLRDGTALAGAALVAATGVRAAHTAEVPWITSTADFPQLSDSAPEELGHNVVVLGGDRPLGTWLRTHPDAGQKLTVCHTAAETYKVEEVQDDPRVRLVSVEAVDVSGHGPFTVAVTRSDGSQEIMTAESVATNAGTLPQPLPGLATGPDGFCPPDRQHPRIVTAGDMSGRLAQRVSVASGAGARAALELYSRFGRQAV
ncbi:FAD-dependent oxidoreductase [Streptomyces sp. TLI_171]|uniref:FAD-dependent oxidoreductase n=1 Tax=Streptomyces sp. TLI_171 TaxID=1938859 RepID=UPI000C19DAE6|nr:FAD-dependent oxidoreductase [Streptomyces sp. TLI_171]RKE02954.1 thioredoxin reductase (NADPH) [Streptomyces sp. TLI_171]